MSEVIITTEQDKPVIDKYREFTVEYSEHFGETSKQFKVEGWLTGAEFIALVREWFA